MFLFIMLLVACDRGSNHGYEYFQPAAGNDGLETAALASVGMDADPIREMMDHVNAIDLHRIHNILILRNDKLVFEEYFQGYALDMDAPGRDGPLMAYNRETDHFMASISKSVTSVIAGIAVDKGFIESLDKKVIEFYPEYTDILSGAKADITLRHLITMTSGLSFDENTFPYGDPRNDVTQLFTVADPIRFVLAKPLTSAPGERFFYNSGTVNVLAAIVAKVAGKKFLDFANEFLFDPLGAEGGFWQALGSGHTFASGGLHFRARELAKIGLLFLNDGQWQGKQIISIDWIDRSQMEHIGTSQFPFAYSYGYLWWIRNFTAKGITHKCYFAAGWGDQYMFIIPDLEMILVFNCGNYAVTGKVSPFDLVEDYILQAVN